MVEAEAGDLLGADGHADRDGQAAEARLPGGVGPARAELGQHRDQGDPLGDLLGFAVSDRGGW